MATPDTVLFVDPGSVSLGLAWMKGPRPEDLLHAAQLQATASWEPWRRIAALVEKTRKAAADGPFFDHVVIETPYGTHSRRKAHHKTLVTLGAAYGALRLSLEERDRPVEAVDANVWTGGEPASRRIYRAAVLFSHALGRGQDQPPEQTAKDLPDLLTACSLGQWWWRRQ